MDTLTFQQHLFVDDLQVCTHNKNDEKQTLHAFKTTTWRESSILSKFSIRPSFPKAILGFAKNKICINIHVFSSAVALFIVFTWFCKHILTNKKFCVLYLDVSSHFPPEFYTFLDKNHYFYFCDLRSFNFHLKGLKRCKDTTTHLGLCFVSRTSHTFWKTVNIQKLDRNNY